LRPVYSNWDCFHLQYYSAKPAKAAESLIAQLHSQGLFTTPRFENRKIRHKIEILKANESAPNV
jgi:hypothetical protein